MLIRYRLEKTDNNVDSVPDFTRLRGITARLCAERSVLPTPEILDHFEDILVQRYNLLQKEGGICVGMVCEWAWKYLITHDPALAPKQMPSQRHQGHAFLTVFKRTYKGKIDDDTAAIAERKLFEHQGMTLSDVRSKMLPDVTVKFGAVISEIADLMKPETPFLLSVPPMSGGRHALGLLEHDGAYYVLEPNEGLFRFSNRVVFEDNLNNHFIQKFRPEREWKLKSISI
jgi:hypothetical protein